MYVSEPDEAMKFARCQREAEEAVSRLAVAAAHLGGPDAVDEYLHESLANLLGVAIRTQGTRRACLLLKHGGAIVKAYRETPRC